MPKKVLAASIVALVITLVGSPAGAGKAGKAGKAAGGTATAVNTILAVRIGDVVAKFGVDRADSALSATPYASAGLNVLESDVQSISGATRDSRNGDPSGASAIGAGTKSVPGILSATVTTGTVETLVEPTTVSSSISFDVASADLQGLSHLGSIKTTTGTTVGGTEASVTRSIEIGSASVGSLGSLLDGFGVDPLALGCVGVEAAGTELGVDTGMACESLDTIQSAIGDTQSALDSARGVLDADLAAASATVAGLTLINPALFDLAARYGIDLTGNLLIPLTAQQRQALIDEISGRIDTVADGIAEAAGETARRCSARSTRPRRPCRTCPRRSTRWPPRSATPAISWARCSATSSTFHSFRSTASTSL